MDELAQVVDNGSHADLLASLGRLNERQRKQAATWFLAQWKERRDAPHPRDGNEPLARWMRLLVGLVATAADPKKALAIPVSHWGLHYRHKWTVDDAVDHASPEAVAALAQALIGRGADWCAQYLALVTDAKKPQPMFVDVLLQLMRAHGLALPTTPVLPKLWAVQFHRLLPRDESGRTAALPSSVQALRASPDTEAMLLAVFDHRDVVLAMAGRYASQADMDMAAEIVAELIADGTVDSATLAERAIAALSRGDSVGSQRLQTRLLKAAQPSPTVVRAQARVLGNLLASAAAPAASLAQDLLRQADTATQPLPDDLFVDTCQMAFSRKEKGLRDTQLRWALGRSATAGTLPSAVNGLTAALLCPDHGIQQEAAKAIGSAWPALDAVHRPTLLAQIEASQGVLDAGLYAALWSACTGSAEAAPTPERAPPPRLGLQKQAFASVTELDHLPADVLQALQTYQLDRDALAYERAIWAAIDTLNGGRAGRAAAIGAKLGHATPFGAGSSWRDRVTHELSWVAHCRIAELQEALAKGEAQAFVSRPSWAHGAIAPEDLADRLATLAAQGSQALPVDLLVALLRTETTEPAAIARLRSIGSTQAQVAADFLAAGGTDQLTTRWLIAEGLDESTGWHPRHEAKWYRKGAGEVCVALQKAPHPPAIDGAPLGWAEGFEAKGAPYTYEFDMVPDWITPLLPNNAEALAAMHLWGFRRAGLEYDTDGGKVVAVRLPLFTAAHGPAGPALHLAVFYAMSANDAPVRLAGSDGMIALLQQGRWQDALASDLLAECLRRGSVKPSRLAASLAQVREAGEFEAVWALLRRIIPVGLDLNPLPANLADLLALGAEVASSLGAKTPIQAVSALVSSLKGKPNKLQLQAQRLHAVLAA